MRASDLRRASFAVSTVMLLLAGAGHAGDATCRKEYERAEKMRWAAVRLEVSKQDFMNAAHELERCKASHGKSSRAGDQRVGGRRNTRTANRLHRRHSACGLKELGAP